MYEMHQIRIIGGWNFALAEGGYTVIRFKNIEWVSK